MEALQREIEDERRARVNKISQTGGGSLGCRLSTPWIDRFFGETSLRPPEPVYPESPERVQGISAELITRHQPVIVIGTRESAELLGVRYDFSEWSSFGLERTPPRPGIALTSWRRANNEVNDTVGRSRAQRLRHRELEWRQTHTAELRRYENQWVVLEGEEIVAHHSNAAQAIRQAKSRGIRTPYIFFVEPESDDSVRIGL